jgi:uncharacterized membrane protein YkvA (DUF1232 family)
MINLPTQIPKKLRERIESRFAAIIGSPLRDSFNHVTFELPRLLDSLSHHSGTWLGSVAEHAERMFDICNENLQGETFLEPNAERVIIAALLYLVEQTDVIPDYELAYGYLDDAYVLNLCLKRIKKSQPDLLPIIENTAGGTS